MKRVYVDEKIDEIIEMQTKKCEEVLKNPKNPSFDKAKRFSEELEALTSMINCIKSLPDSQNTAMSQEDTNVIHYHVRYVSSRDELNKFINKRKKQNDTIIIPLDKNCNISTEKLSDMGMYVNVCKVISEQYASGEFMRERICEKMWENFEKTGQHIVTPDQFEQIWDEVLYQYFFGKTATYYVSIRKKF